MITMKSEEVELNCKPSRTGMVAKLMLLLSFVLAQMNVVAAWSFQDKVLTPLWDGLVGFFIPIGGIILVAVGMGKASQIEGIPTWTKALLAVLGIAISFAFASALGSLGGTDIGGGVQSFIGDIYIFD